MAQATTYKRTMSGSIGAGMTSVFGSSGRRFYILEHKTSSKYHRAGENQQIIVDQIELGRASTCQVRFDESFATVSRRHAAIVKEGDGWKLVQLSHTNSTYLNGKKVQTEWFLRSGDEIQLSTNGPMLGFIVPEGKKGTVGSIGLTRRLSLFRQQALRPYKTALSILSVFLLLIALVGGYMLYEFHGKNKRLAKEAEDLKTRMEFINDSLNKEMRAFDDTLKLLHKNIDSLKKPVKKFVKNSGQKVSTVSGVSNGNYSGLTSAIRPYIYSIKVESIEYQFIDGTRQVVSNTGNIGSTGTAFLLSGGRLITARHIVEPWLFRNQNIDEDVNIQYSNGSAKIIANLVARSPMGEELRLRSSEFQCIRRADRELTAANGITYTYAPEGSYLDCGFFFTGNGAGLIYSESDIDIRIGGSAYCVSVNGNASPSVFKADITANGFASGWIYTNNSNSGKGRAGGPVLVQKGKNDYVVVGITSTSKGAVIPIGNVTP